MNHKLLKESRARWKKISALERKELRRLSVAQRFQQISSLVGMGIGLGVASTKDKEKAKTRARWILLKNNHNEKFA